jgi:hypothetical protein
MVDSLLKYYAGDCSLSNVYFIYVYTTFRVLALVPSGCHYIDILCNTFSFLSFVATVGIVREDPLNTWLPR